MRTAWLVTSGFALLLCAVCIPAQALTFPFTENFDSNRAAWEGYGDNIELGHSLTEGVNDSGYVFHSTDVNALPNSDQLMGSQGLLLFRANAADNASGGAFTGNWLAAGVTNVTAYVQHDYEHAPIDFFLRITGGNPGAGAVLFDLGVNPIVDTGDNWTRLSFEISEANSMATSGDFNSVLPNVANFTIGAILAQDLSNAGIPISFKLDQVSLVPEPSSILLVLGACVGLLLHRRRMG